MDETSADQGAVRLVHDDDRDRFAAYEGETVVAVLAFEDEGAVRDLRSTVVAPDRSGRGIGSAIVRFALEDSRARGLSIRPTCWFVRGYVERHPEYADLLETSGTTPDAPDTAPGEE
ncbi:GNAT family N-acetyltransferase [Brachybacterium sp. EE-P12]|uniref:N-acetyltransferase n=1 Tax=Candidatus Brachybacterium intestinipullorum TaxID=2838512 RepID=A0A9D2TIZ5_9MICO|nr:GNAT family N-acetyltransferase [Brachybacterium sp. EE-P12]HJC70227.1 N-acetyltransferase [Candidatus Brachybacterium intestinipullorum]